MKTDRFYLEMIIFAGVNPFIFGVTLILFESINLAGFIGIIVGCLQYLWMRKKLKRKS